MKDRLHNIYYKMRQRCNNPNNADYKNYGGRGISYCLEWKETQNFIDWAINNGYSEKLTLDRIDVNKDYCPENCRWITIKEQQRNRRNNKYVEWRGEHHCCNEWDEILGFPVGTIRQRLSRNWTIERAMTQSFSEKQYNYNKRGIRKTQIIFPNGNIKNYKSLDEAARDTGITSHTLRSLSTVEGQTKSRRYKGYKVIFLD